MKKILLAAAHQATKAARLATLSAIMVSSLCVTAHADCVISAKSKTSFVVLDSHTIILQGGLGADIVIKTYSYLNKNSNVSVLKDSFCSYTSEVLYIDGELIDVNSITKLD